MGLFDGLSHNPFSDRHEKYDNDRYWACSKKISLSQKSCYTCTYWQGDRRVTRKTLDGYVIIPQNQPSAECKKIYGKVYTIKDSCSNWKEIQ